MLDAAELRSIVMLNYLTDEMLEKILAVTSIRDVEAGEYVFQEGEYAGYLYAIMEGKVVLEVAKNPTRRITVAELTRGNTFGLSAIVDSEQRSYVAYARTVTDARLFTWKREDLERLFHEDRDMGFLLMKRVAKILNFRLHIRNTQLADMYS